MTLFVISIILCDTRTLQFWVTGLVTQDMWFGSQILLLFFMSNKTAWHYRSPEPCTISIFSSTCISHSSLGPCSASQAGKHHELVLSERLSSFGNPVCWRGKALGVMFEVLLRAQNSQAWVSLGQTGCNHESQVPSYLLKLDWSTLCSLSHRQPCLYLSQGTSLYPDLSSCSHPPTIGQSAGAFVPWEGEQHEQRGGMAPIHECLGVSSVPQLVWPAHVGGSADAQWDLAVPLRLAGTATMCWDKKWQKRCWRCSGRAVPGLPHHDQSWADWGRGHPAIFLEVTEWSTVTRSLHHSCGSTPCQGKTLMLSLLRSHWGREGSLFTDWKRTVGRGQTTCDLPGSLFNIPNTHNWKLSLAAAPSCGTIVATSAIKRKTEQFIKHSCGNVVSVFSGFIWILFPF